MPVVIHMEFKRRRPERFLISWDSGEEILFSPEICLKFHIAPHKSFDSEAFQEILFQNDTILAKEQALKYLTRRPHSRSELLRKISIKGYSEEAILAALTALSRVGLVNDRDFARSFIDNEIRMRPCGRLLLQEKLRQRGVEQEIFDPLLDSAYQKYPESEMSLQIAQKFVNRAIQRDPQKLKEKLIRRLQSRAFGWDSIRPALQVLVNLPNEDPADEFETP